MTAIRTLSAFVLLPFLATSAAAGTVTLVPVQDSTLYSQSGSVANGAGDYVFAGTTAQSAKRRALVRFDVASAVPAGSTILSAALVLNMSQSAVGPVDVRLHRVLASWGEGASNATGQEGTGTTAQAGDATWTMRFFPSTPWTTAGGDFAATPSAIHTVDFGPGDTWSSLATANDVQSWLNAPASNFGWILIGPEGAGASAKRFDSRTNPTPANRPQLVIDFTPPLVPANYCTATANSTGLPGRLEALSPPSLANGALQLAASDLPPNTSCTFFFGTQRTETPLGNGNLCVTGSVFRLGTSQASPGGVATRSVSYGTVPGNAINPFSTWCFQAQYRNVAAGGAGFNQTDGLAVTFLP